MSALAWYLQARLDKRPMHNGRRVLNPGVNETVEFVHVNFGVDVHQDGT
jgi:hypothetical protein